MEVTSREGITRRSAVRGVAVAGVGVPLLAGCTDQGVGEAVDRASEAADKAGDAASEAGKAVESLVRQADVPVGGGVVIETAKVVVTQPTEGEFKAFSAVCTHQGTMVDGIQDDAIHCPNHGSLFSPEDGSVVQGPATKALPEVGIKVDGDKILAA